jgi:hypothetical protein
LRHQMLGVHVSLSDEKRAGTGPGFIPSSSPASKKAGRPLLERIGLPEPHQELLEYLSLWITGSCSIATKQNKYDRSLLKTFVTLRVTTNNENTLLFIPATGRNVFSGKSPSSAFLPSAKSSRAHQAVRFFHKKTITHCLPRQSMIRYRKSNAVRDPFQRRRRDIC